MFHAACGWTRTALYRTADTHALLDEFQALYSIVTYLVTKIVIYYNLVLCL